MALEAGFWLSFGIVVVGGMAVLATKWCQRMDEALASKGRKTVAADVQKEEHELIVGREYMYKAASGDEWKACIYMGKQLNGKYLFWNVKNGDRIEVTTRSGTRHSILDDVNFKWLPDHMQSKLDCPACENIT